MEYIYVYGYSNGQYVDGDYVGGEQTIVARVRFTSYYRSVTRAEWLANEFLDLDFVDYVEISDYSKFIRYRLATIV